jgi:hypothetical protein
VITAVTPVERPVVTEEGIFADVVLVDMELITTPAFALAILSESLLSSQPTRRSERRL